MLTLCRSIALSFLSLVFSTQISLAQPEVPQRAGSAVVAIYMGFLASRACGEPFDHEAAFRKFIAHFRSTGGSPAEIRESQALWRRFWKGVYEKYGRKPQIAGCTEADRQALRNMKAKMRVNIWP